MKSPEEVPTSLSGSVESRRLSTNPMVQLKIEIFAAMLAEQPENAMIWYGLASEQYKLENWAEAAKSLRQVVSLNPDYTAAYQMLGTVLANTGDLAEAQQAWKGARFTSTQPCCFRLPAV